MLTTISEELLKLQATSLDAQSAKLSLPLCTALQLAVFRFLQRLGIDIQVAVGHSTGEIAAAYASGHLSLEKALAVAYYYGRECAEEKQTGGMAVLNLGVAEIHKKAILRDGLVVACVNSPQSTTISGDESVLQDFLYNISMDEPAISVSRLHVDRAYHSGKSPRLHSRQSASLSRIIGMMGRSC